MTIAKQRTLARLKAKVEQRREAAVSKATVEAKERGNQVVRIDGFKFSPSCVRVNQYYSVTWVCQVGTLGEVETHQLVFKNEQLPPSPEISTGQSFTTRFDEPGTFEYYCSNYPYMNGFVQVMAGDMPPKVKREKENRVNNEEEGDDDEEEEKSGTKKTGKKKKTKKSKRKPLRRKISISSNSEGSSVSGNSMGGNDLETEEDEEQGNNAGDIVRYEWSDTLASFSHDLHEIDEEHDMYLLDGFDDENDDQDDMEEDISLLAERVREMEEKARQLESIDFSDQIGFLQEHQEEQQRQQVQKETSQPISDETCPKTHHVSVLAYKFEPKVIQAKQGDTIRWVVRDDCDTQFCLEGDDGTGFMDSGLLSAGRSFEHKFMHPGTFNYNCTIFSWMKGSVEVSPTLSHGLKNDDDIEKAKLLLIQKSTQKIAKPTNIKNAKPTKAPKKKRNRKKRANKASKRNNTEHETIQGDAFDRAMACEFLHARWYQAIQK